MGWDPGRSWGTLRPDSFCLELKVMTIESIPYLWYDIYERVAHSAADRR